MTSKRKQQQTVRYMDFLLEVYNLTKDWFVHVEMTKLARKHCVQSISTAVMIENKLIESDNVIAKRYRKYKWSSTIPPNVHTANKLIELVDKKFKYYKDKPKEDQSDVDTASDDRQFVRTHGLAIASSRGMYINMALALAGIAIDKKVLDYLEDITYLIGKSDGDVTLREITSLVSFQKLQLAGVELPETNQIQ